MPRQTQVVIERKIHPATPMIVADFSRMVQILYNLMGNSLKFTSVRQCWY